MEHRHRRGFQPHRRTAVSDFRPACQQQNPFDACAHSSNVLYWQNLSGPLGVTSTCVSGTRLVRFTIVIDSAPAAGSWYTGTGDAPSDRYDLWSVASHEFGHATGWGPHFAEDSPECPNDSTRHTMCGGIYIGTERQRTLTTHDIHTYDGRY